MMRSPILVGIWTAIDIGVFFVAVKVLGVGEIAAAFVVLAVSINAVRAKCDAIIDRAAP